MDTQKLETEYKEKNCWGMVASIDVYGCDPVLISDKGKIHDFIVELVDAIGMKRHGAPMIDRFAEGSLEGCSAMQFIETSSVTIHNDEGQNRSFIDIFSCKFFDYKKAEDFCRTWLKGSSSKSVYLLRN